jgi:hypothetical protein
MLSKEDNDFVTGHLYPHIAARGRVLHNNSNERAHHQMEVQGRKVWCEASYYELEEVQCLKIDFWILIL